MRIYNKYINVSFSFFKVHGNAALKGTKLSFKFCIGQAYKPTKTLASCLIFYINSLSTNK